MGHRVMPWESGYDPEWDSPEAIAKWRVRGIRDIFERQKEFHRIKAELEISDCSARLAIGQKPHMREDEIEAGTRAIFEDLQKKHKAQTDS